MVTYKYASAQPVSWEEQTNLGLYVIMCGYAHLDNKIYSPADRKAAAEEWHTRSCDKSWAGHAQSLALTLAP